MPDAGTILLGLFICWQDYYLHVAPPTCRVHVYALETCRKNTKHYPTAPNMLN